MTVAAPSLPAILAAWRSRLARRLGQQVDVPGDPDHGGFRDRHGWCDGRDAAYVLGRLLALRCRDDDPALPHNRLDAAIAGCTAFLLRRQHPDGRLDLSGKYSPNEAGFPITAIAAGYGRLGDALDPEVRAGLERFLRRGAEAVLAGEAYTANHRWAAACAPLAAVHALWPDPRLRERIDDYLADGIDLDEHGHWHHEASPNYNMVANQGLLAMARFLDRPDLVDLVRRNLDFLLEQVQPDGTCDASYSRRQDRASPDAPPANFTVAYAMACRTRDGRYRALADLAWQRGDIGMSLLPVLYLVDDAEPPPPEPLPDRYHRHYASLHLARIRTPGSALTLVADPGGHFFTDVRDQWGGPKRSDDWLHLHHGALVIQSIHLAGAGMGNAMPSRLERLDERRYRLADRVEGSEHRLHFRREDRTILIPWGWENRFEVAIEGEEGWRLALASTTAESLYGTLRLWLRDGTEVSEGGHVQRIEAGAHHLLAGGEAVALRRGDDVLLLEGLPPAAHRVPLRLASPIPSQLERHCGSVAWGFRFPLGLELRLRPVSSAAATGRGAASAAVAREA